MKRKFSSITNVNSKQSSSLRQASGSTGSGGRDVEASDYVSIEDSDDDEADIRRSLESAVNANAKPAMTKKRTSLMSKLRDMNGDNEIILPPVSDGLNHGQDEGQVIVVQEKGHIRDQGSRVETSSTSANKPTRKIDQTQEALLVDSDDEDYASGKASKQSSSVPPQQQHGLRKASSTAGNIRKLHQQDTTSKKKSDSSNAIKHSQDLTNSTTNATTGSRRKDQAPAADDPFDTTTGSSYSYSNSNAKKQSTVQHGSGAAASAASVSTQNKLSPRPINGKNTANNNAANSNSLGTHSNGSKKGSGNTKTVARYGLKTANAAEKRKKNQQETTTNKKSAKKIQKGNKTKGRSTASTNVSKKKPLRFALEDTDDSSSSSSGSDDDSSGSFSGSDDDSSDSSSSSDDETLSDRRKKSIAQRKKLGSARSTSTRKRGQNSQKTAATSRGISPNNASNRNNKNPSKALLKNTGRTTNRPVRRQGYKKKVARKEERGFFKQKPRKLVLPRKNMGDLVRDLHRIAYDEGGKLEKIFDLGPFMSIKKKTKSKKSATEKRKESHFPARSSRTDTVDANEQLLDMIASSHPSLHGWKMTSNRRRKKKYEINCEDHNVSIRVSRDYMLNLMKKNSHGYGATDGDNDTVDEFEVGRLEEDILLDMVERQISVSASIEKSQISDEHSFRSPILPPVSSSRSKSSKIVSQSDKKRNRRVSATASDSPSFPPSDTNSEPSSLPSGVDPLAGKKSPAPLPSKETNTRGSDKKKSKNSRTGPKKPLREIVRASKCFPKYYGNTSEALIDRDMIQQIKDKILDDLPLKNSMERHLLKITLDEIKTQHNTVAVKALGQKDLIDDLLGRLCKSVNYRIGYHNGREIITDSKSIEMCIKFDVSVELGFKATKCPDGIWVTSKGSGQFHEVFGSDVTAVITEMGAISGEMKKITSAKAKNQIFKHAQETFQRTERDADRWVVAKISLNKSYRLNSLDKSRVVLKNGHPIRRRDGTLSDQMKFYNTEVRNRSKKKKEKPRRPVAKINGRFQNHDSSHLGNIRTQQKRRASDIPAGRSSAEPFARIPQKRRASEISAGGSTAEPVAKRKNIQTDKGKSYKYFSEQMKEVTEIEFGGGRLDGRVHLQFAKSEMWKAHKKLIGEHCDERCECASLFPKLTERVRDEFIQDRLEKNPYWEVPSTIRQSEGFAQHFCAKFYDKVKSHFPSDTNSEILSKLIKMWRAHCGQHRFSGVCSKDCDCLNFWDTLFLPKILPGKKKLSNKKKAVGKESIPKKLKSKIPMEEEFFVYNFRPSRYDLGFYCITDKVGDDEVTTRCVITSVNPNRATKNHVLKPGMILDAYLAGKNSVDEWKKIENHDDIRKAFDAIKIRGDNTVLQIRFKTALEQSGNPDNKASSNEWNTRGAWIGKTTNGWAGGANVDTTENQAPQQKASVAKKGRIVKPRDGTANVTMKEKIANIRQNDKPTASAMQLSIPSPPNPPTLAQNETSLPSSSIPTHSANSVGGLNSILRRPGSRSSGRTVTFSKECNYRIINQKKKKYEASKEGKATKDAYQSLMRIALNGKIYFLWDRLDKNRIPMEHFIEMNTKMNDKIKELERNIFSMDSQSGADEHKRIQNQIKFDAMQKSLSDLKLKRKLVKIYHKAMGRIEKMTDMIVDGADTISEIIHCMDGNSKTLSDVLQWVKNFRKETEHGHMRIPLESNIDVYGVSLLHAAVYSGDLGIVKRYLDDGAQLVDNADTGTPLDLAVKLCKMAENENNQEWASKYKKVAKILEARKKGTT